MDSLSRMPLTRVALLLLWLGGSVKGSAAQTVAVPIGSTESAVADCHDAGISADGRFVVFVSRADDLVPNDLNNASDLFVRDQVSGVTTLVTRDRFGSASAQGGGPVFADMARISDDGRWVAFSSGATNLVVNDNNQKADVFVRDLLNRTNIL